MPYCVHCGQELIPNEARCASCGTAVSVPASVTTTSGGVTLSATTINITGDVTGRDKLTGGATATSPTLRATPPRPPDHFTGREADLEKFTRLLTSGQNVAITALHGLGGIGKTSLAQKLAEQIGRGDPGGRPYFPGGVLWWTLGPSPDVITALDVWARHADPRADLTSLPTAEARAEAVRPLLAKLGKLCVIIDDVWDAPSFNALKSAVPAGCPVLMTTRDADLAKTLRCRVERIDALSDDEAVALLTNLLGPLGEYEEAACDIAHLTEGLPLALELIYGVAESPADLPRLAEKLRTHPALDVLSRGTTREQSIEACFALSYAALTDDLRQRFAALGVFALAPFGREAIAAVWADDNDERIDQALQLLTRRSLLNKDESSHEYRQHSLLHAYALKLLEQDEKFNSVIEMYAAFYSNFMQLNNWRSIERVFEQIEQGWKWVLSRFPEKIEYYISSVQRYLFVRGRFTILLQWFKDGLVSARDTNDPRLIGGLINGLGYTYHELGEKPKALEALQEALKITRQANLRVLESSVLSNLGLLHLGMGQVNEALAQYNLALSICKETKDVDGEGTVLSNLGQAFAESQDTKQALFHYQAALRALQATGNRLMESVTLCNIGLAYYRIGNLYEAMKYSLKSYSVACENGARVGESASLNNIGLVLEALGESDSALRYFIKSAQIVKETGDKEHLSETLYNIAGIFFRMGNVDLGFTYFQETIDLEKEIGDPDADKDEALLERLKHEAKRVIPKKTIARSYSVSKFDDRRPGSV